MKVLLKGYFEKFLFRIPVDAKVEVNIPFEFLAQRFVRGTVKAKIFEVLSKFNFTGNLKIDNETFELIKGSRKRA